MTETKELKQQNRKRKSMIYMIALTGIMTALAEVLMMLEIPLPLMPGFLKYDFSDIPALFAGFACGPVAGVIVEFLKNLIHMPFPVPNISARWQTSFPEVFSYLPAR